MFVTTLRGPQFYVYLDSMSLSVSLNFSWQSSHSYEIPVQLFRIDQLKKQTKPQNSLIYSVTQSH